MSKEKRKKQNNRPVYLPQTGFFAVATGSLCRFLVALAGAFGLCLMINDSFRFTGSLDARYVFTVCLICGLAAYVTAAARNINPVFYLVTVISAAVFAFAAVIRIGFARFFIYAPITAWNRAVTSVAKSGFSSLTYFLSGFEGTDPSAPGADADIRIAFTVFCAFVCFIFVHSVIRKTRLTPPFIMSAAVMTLCFTYNLINENFGFLFLVSSAFGMLVLRYCDFRQSVKRKEKKKNGDVKRSELFKRASVSGVAGFVAAALVFAVGAYPAKKVKEPVREVGFLSSIIGSMRKVLYSYVSGENLMPETYISLSTDRTPVKPSDRNFEDKRIFELKSAVNNTVYLRSWIGEKFENGSWTVARPLDAAGSTDYMPEDSADLFYRVIGIDENTLNQRVLFDKSKKSYGFITSYISLGNLGFQTDMYYLPSRFSSHYGIMEYDKEPTYIRALANYSVKRNGMVTLFSAYEPSYSAVAHLPYYLASDFLTRMNDAIYEYKFTVAYLYAFVFNTPDVKSVSKETVEKIEQFALDGGITLSKTNIVYSLPMMSEEELGDLSVQLSLAGSEQINAYANYLSVPSDDLEYLQSDAKAAVGDLIDNSPYLPYQDGKAPYDFDTVYRMVYQIALYLADTAEYTLEPYGYKDGSSYVYQFLHTAKNGYCVQYATAAVMLLRSLGIPARYVEGFKTSEFEPDGKGYKTVILDNDSHAWVEVYADGPGWMTFEVTEPMISDMYGDGPAEKTPVTPPDTGSIDPPETSYNTGIPPIPHVTDTDVSDTDTDPATDTDTDTDEPSDTVYGTSAGRGRFRIPAGVIIAAAAVFAVFTAVFLYLSYRKKKLEKLNAALRRAADGGAADPYKETVAYCDYLFTVLSVLGYTREKTEQTTGFAARAGAELGCEKELSDAADAALKATFAGKADEEDCVKAAKCALTLQKTAKEKLTGFKKFRYITLRKLV